VSNVIVTHLHADHQGSLPAVMNLASGATGYAGAADIAGITSPRELTAVGDGDRVFDLRIIETPGHTPGHISVLDEAGRLLVAGDALNGANGTVVGANPDFTSDPVTAGESVKKLAEFSFDTVVFGHGEPVSENASQQVAELASQI
jgi:glyoxylase-like metal-dependent hydrolase (beta-lactamase superfamily II)